MRCSRRWVPGPLGIGLNRGTRSHRFTAKI